MVDNFVVFFLNEYVTNIFFILYLAVLFADIVTGNLVALYERKWNSHTGINGTIRHLALLTIVMILLPVIYFTTQLAYISEGILIYIVSQYLISVLENLQVFGFDLNESFSSFFKYLNNENNKQDNKEGK